MPATTRETRWPGSISERFTRWGAIQRVLFHKRKKIGADHYRAPRNRVGPRSCSVSLPTPPLGKEQVPVARSTPPGCGARAFWSAPAPNLGEIPIGRSRVHKIRVPKLAQSIYYSHKKSWKISDFAPNAILKIKKTAYTNFDTDFFSRNWWDSY